MKCPKCQSNTLTSVPLLYKKGTSIGTTTGVGISRGGIGVGIGKNISQSLLAQELAPPKRPSYWLHYLYLFVLVMPSLALLAQGHWIFVIPLILFGFIGIKWASHTRQKYQNAIIEWQNSYFCLACGYEFVE